MKEDKIKPSVILHLRSSAGGEDAYGYCKVCKGNRSGSTIKDEKLGTEKKICMICSGELECKTPVRGVGWGSSGTPPSSRYGW